MVVVVTERLTALGESETYSRAHVECYTFAENSEVDHRIFLSLRGAHFRLLSLPPGANGAQLVEHLRRQLAPTHFLMKWKS